MATVFWIGFITFVLFMLILDVTMFHRKAHEVSIREAFGWSIFWIVLAFSFSGLIYLIYQNDWFGVEDGLSGAEAMQQYLTGWLIEESLSVDNLFVFAMIFSYFQVPGKYQHRVLFWGILGAIIMRGLMIGAGAALINRFEWAMYFFALLLLYAALKMLFFEDKEFDPKKNLLFKLAHRIWPVTTGYSRDHFIVTLPDGRKAITPLFLVLLVVESSDVLFALDSVPAIFGITREPFIVFTSNIFAVLGLRSLYFVLAAMLSKFAFLKYGLVLVLIFVAAKMLLHQVFPIATGTSLLIVSILLGGGVLASLVFRKSDS